MLTPSFHFNILEAFLPAMNEQAIVLVNIIREKVKNGADGTLDVAPLITNCALDIICGMLLGDTFDFFGFEKK